MRMIRRLAPLVALLLAATACGDDATGVTTVPASTTTTATTATSPTASSSSSTSPPTGTIADMAGARVEDPLLGTGFHTVDWADAAMSYLRSAAPVDGGSSLLAIAPLQPAPVVGDLDPGALLAAVWIETSGPEVAPSGVAVYLEGPSGWEAQSTVTAQQVLEFLESTTDYQAIAVNEPVLPVLVVTSWGIGSEGFVADVAVHSRTDGAEPLFEGEVECLLASDGPVCLLISDDGVLRPGDQGDPVAALQGDLAVLGYYTGSVDGEYGPGTETAVRQLQRDYRLDQDGRAGPNTQAIIEALVDGTSDIVMAGPNGVGDILLGLEDNTAYAGLIGIFGTPDTTTGWYVDACDGNDWFKATWRGFTAIFTDRGGFRQFDGWRVDDISDLPDWLYFAYGIRPGTDWADLEAIGAGWEPAYGGVWYQNEIGYNNGRLAPGFGNPPASDDQVVSFGTGTGGFVSC